MKKTNTKFELRMYSLNLYNVSPIQASIQAYHSGIEYALKYWKDSEFQDWAKNWKTVILLSGGTSNDGLKRKHIKNSWFEGTMESHLKELRKNGIKCTPFYEPDLNWAMTSISFLVDERVFNKEKYPDDDIMLPQPKSWLKNIGGKKNEFLRTFLSQFRLSNN